MLKRKTFYFSENPKISKIFIFATSFPFKTYPKLPTIYEQKQEKPINWSQHVIYRFASQCYSSKATSYLHFLIFKFLHCSAEAKTFNLIN